VTEAELEGAALAAISTAAERLGVDPFRLARFLAHGRIADFLQTLGRAEAMEKNKQEAVDLSSSYLEFLDEEMRLRDRRGGERANGG
jgi:hypothetical protein